MTKISLLTPECDLDGNEQVVLVKDGFTRRAAVSGLVGVAVAPHVEAAELAASTALAASNFFGVAQYGTMVAAIAAGEAGTAVGGLFSVDDDNGTLLFFEKTGSGSVEVAKTITPGAMAGHGDSLTGIKPEFGGQYLQTLSDVRRGDPVSPLRWIDQVRHSAIIDATSTWDADERIQQMIRDLRTETGFGATAAFPRGRFNLANEVHIPALVNFQGAGEFSTRFHSTTADGRIRWIANSALDLAGGNRGGMSGGFTVYGDDIGEDLLIFDVTVERVFQNMSAWNSAGNGVLVRGAQNCLFQQVHAQYAAAVGMIIDWGAGNNEFVKGELNHAGTWSLKFQDSGTQPPGYDIFPEGPKLNRFQNYVIERGGYVSAADDLDPDINLGRVLHEAGTANAILGGSIDFGDITSGTKPVIKMTKPGSAPSNSFVIGDGILIGGTPANTRAFELDSDTEVILNGRVLLENHIAAFAMEDGATIRGDFYLSQGSVASTYINRSGGTATREAQIVSDKIGRELRQVSAVDQVHQQTLVDSDSWARFEALGAGFRFGNGSTAATLLAQFFPLFGKPGFLVERSAGNGVTFYIQGIAVVFATHDPMNETPPNGAGFWFSRTDGNSKILVYDSDTSTWKTIATI